MDGRAVQPEATPASVLDPRPEGMAAEQCCIYQPVNWDPQLECEAAVFSAGNL
jgi:hypothetical protein